MEIQEQEKPTSDWEQQAAIYHTALEVALTYQHELEKTIATLRENYQELEEQDTAMLEELHCTQQRANRQEQTIEQLQKAINQLQNTVTQQRERLKKENRAIMQRNQWIKCRDEQITELFQINRGLDQTINTQNKQIAHLEKTLQLQQRLLRQQRET